MSRKQKGKSTGPQPRKTAAPAAKKAPEKPDLPAVGASVSKPAMPDKRRRIKRLHEVTAADDIRYRGPLSYQGFQALGWACIVASVLRLILAISSSKIPSCTRTPEH